MRLPSVDKLLKSARVTASRFPLVLACGVVAAVAGMTAVDATDEQFWLRLLFSSALGLPLFFVTKLVAERRGWSASLTSAARLAGIALLAAFFFAWPSWSDPVRVERLVQAAVALHLLAAFAPFLGTREENGFWQYNRALLLRFLTAALYSVVLFIGLAIALAAIDNLLGIDIDGENYFRLWLAIAFVFNTWFFLAGAPTDLSALETWSDYPTELKIFSQYVLIPLVAIYLVILTLYMGRILITTVWPSGWIGYLVSSVAVAGILSLLLVHPISDRDENRWIRTYARWFYIALLPSIAMLLLAIWKRIDQYGVTEKRYFLAVLALWLAAIAIFYALTRSRWIRVIPITLFAIAVLTFAGPWSAYSVSERSQIRRLVDILGANGMLDEGRASRAAGEVSFEDRQETSAILRYLLETHGTRGIEPLFGRTLAEIDTMPDAREALSRHEADERARLLTESLGLAYVGRYERGLQGFFSYNADPRSAPIRIVDYDYALYMHGQPGDTFDIDGETLGLGFGPDSASVHVSLGGVTELVLPLEPLYERARMAAAGGAPGLLTPEALRLEGESDRLSIALYFTWLTGRETAEGRRAQGGRAEVFVRLKPAGAPGAPDQRGPAGAPEDR